MEDAFGLLRYDPGAVVLRQAGNDEVLSQLAMFGAKLVHYAELAKQVNAAAAANNSSTQNEGNEEEEEEEEELEPNIVSSGDSEVAGADEIEPNETTRFSELEPANSTQDESLRHPSEDPKESTNQPNQEGCGKGQKHSLNRRGRENPANGEKAVPFERASRGNLPEKPARKRPCLEDRNTSPSNRPYSPLVGLSGVAEAQAYLKRQLQRLPEANESMKLSLRTKMHNSKAYNVSKNSATQRRCYNREHYGFKSDYLIVKKTKRATFLKYLDLVVDHILKNHVDDAIKSQMGKPVESAQKVLDIYLGADKQDKETGIVSRATFRGLGNDVRELPIYKMPSAGVHLIYQVQSALKEVKEKKTKKRAYEDWQIAFNAIEATIHFGQEAVKYQNDVIYDTKGKVKDEEQHAQRPGSLVVIVTYGGSKRQWFQRTNEEGIPFDTNSNDVFPFDLGHGSALVQGPDDEKPTKGYKWMHGTDGVTGEGKVSLSLKLRVVDHFEPIEDATKADQKLKDLACTKEVEEVKKMILNRLGAFKK